MTEPGASATGGARAHPRATALGLALLLALGGCAGSQRGTRSAPRGASGTSPPTPAAPVQASVPTGPEECGNARDDNANGVIDDGCDLKSGAIHFVIAWSDPTADVDLLVTDPTGELVEVGRRSAAGLVKERDCPGRSQECRGRNLENVFLDRSDVKRGTYRVRIHLESLGSEDSPIRVTFGARVGPRTYSSEIELGRPGLGQSMEFAL